MESLLKQLKTLDGEDRQTAFDRMAELLAMQSPPEGAASELAAIVHRLGMSPEEVETMVETVAEIRGHLRLLDERPTIAQRRKATRQNFIRARELYQQVIEAMDRELREFYKARLLADGRYDAFDQADTRIKKLRQIHPELLAAVEKSHVAQPPAPEIPELPRAELLHPRIPEEPATPTTPEPPAAAESPEPAEAPAPEIADPASAGEPPLLADAGPEVEEQRNTQPRSRRGSRS